MENPIVKVEHLYHRYTSSRWAIEDINFQIDEAGVVGLLGSNGAGKSTTMNIICGVMRQTTGEVYIDGINTLKEPVKARKLIGFLPQKPPLYPDLTIDEYLRFCAEIQWMDKKKIKSAIAVAEERCGITHMKDRLLRNLWVVTSNASGWLKPSYMIRSSWSSMNRRTGWIRTRYWKFAS